MEGNYDQLVEFISENSGVAVDEIERKIEAKQAKLSGLISREGAAQVIAAELNVNFDKQRIKISHIVPGMRKINIVGKIITLFPIRSYEKNGRSGRIASFVLADDTSNIRTVLWDENHIDIIEKGDIVQDSIVEIGNASVRNGELHLTSFSEISSSDVRLEGVVTEKPVFKKQIVEFSQGESVSTRAFIIQVYEPRFFQVCSECRKKVGEDSICGTHGKVTPEKRALLSFVIDDGSDTIRAVMFSDALQKIMNFEDLEKSDLFSVHKADLLGKEMILSGQVRKNQMYDSQEFIVSDLEDVDVDALIVELEK